MAGSHEHRFTNPAGRVFDIGCFSEAPGAGMAGTPTLEHTWFPGWRWNFALCKACGEHLGWFFRAPDGDGFFGLILSHLIYPA